MRITLSLATLLMLALWTAPRSATVTLDPNTSFQTIEGLGVAVADWLYGSNNTAQVANLMVQDLGASFLRVYPEPDFEPSQGQFAPTATNTAAQFAVVQRAVAAGLDRVVLSTFSPPAWMKDNGSLVNGGHLLANMYPAYAEYYSRYVQAMNAAAGRSVVYAVSPENEPEWGQWYSSCIFTYTEMRDAIKAIGQRCATDGLAVKLFAAETLITANWGPYFGTALQDTTAARLLNTLAVHAYENNGVTATSPSAASWRRVRDAAASRSKTAWMTETSGYDASFGNAFTYANGIYTALKYGQLSGWVYLNFNTCTGCNEQEALCINGTPKPIYYASKNYYKWIRPGAVMIKANSSDTSVLSLAFVHPANRTFTMVLTNAGSASASVTLSGGGLPGTCSAWRSSASENCVAIANVTGNSLTLPAQSITTLYATGYATSVREVPTGISRKTGRPGLTGRCEAFALDGRRVGGGVDAEKVGVEHSRSGARGVYCLRAPGGVAAVALTR
jgi:O-glycosyl hydrolase